MVFLKLMIICLVFVNVSSDQCKERPSLSFIVCNTEDQCDNSVTLSEVFDVLEACEKPSSCESSHRYGSICCNLTCYDFVEIIFGSDYLLRDNYTLVNIDNILFTSLAKEKFTIRCMHDYDENTGFTFIAIRNLTIENLNIIECGTKHVSTSQVEVGEFVMFSSAVVIQNSTDVLLNNIIISDSNGIGLSIIDTNGIVEITNSEFSNNTAETRSNITGGGGIYIEFTKCTPGVTNCNPASNLFNHNSIFSIQNCSFECNDAINNNTRFDIAADTYVIFAMEVDYCYFTLVKLGITYCSLIRLILSQTKQTMAVDCLLMVDKMFQTIKYTSQIVYFRKILPLHLKVVEHQLASLFTRLVERLCTIPLLFKIVDLYRMKLLMEQVEDYHGMVATNLQNLRTLSKYLTLLLLAIKLNLDLRCKSTKISFTLFQMEVF